MTKPIFGNLDELDLSRSTLLSSEFEQKFDPGNHRPQHESEPGADAFCLVVSRIGVALIIGSVTAAPKIPPVLALERLLQERLGPDALDDKMKQYLGRLVRFVIEDLGGKHERYGARVNRPSAFKSGSTYRL
jgi:hypothetical protein